MFPYVTAFSGVQDWYHKAECGSCWEIPYNDRSIFVTVIDHCDSMGPSG